MIVNFFDKTSFFKTDLISPFLWSGLNKCSGSRNLLVFRSKLIQFLPENGKHLNWNSIIFKKSNIIMVLILILMMTDPSALFFVHRELLLLDRLQLVSEVELCSLILSRINLCERSRNREIINIELREIEKRRTRGEHKDEHWTMNMTMYTWETKKCCGEVKKKDLTPSFGAWQTCSRTWKPFSVSAWCWNVDVILMKIQMKAILLHLPEYLRLLTIFLADHWRQCSAR